MFEIGDKVKIAGAFSFDKEHIGEIFVIDEIGKNISGKTLYLKKGSYRGWFEEQLVKVDDIENIKTISKDEISNLITGE